MIFHKRDICNGSVKTTLAQNQFLWEFGDIMEKSMHLDKYFVFLFN